MQHFHCENCGQIVHFHNSVCTGCQARLGFIPDVRVIAAFEATPDGGWRRHAGEQGLWQFCANAPLCGCNWLLSPGETDTLCRSCQLTTTIPDQTIEANQRSWRDLESAKRDWLFTILGLALPLHSRLDDPQQGLTFHFLRQVDADRPVLTGHDAGEITINAIESDPVARERSRLNLHEPYRTLVGHFRHESGHYYWDRLIRDSSHLATFRTLFGDERADYAQALADHYENGPPTDWPAGYVSGYATMHPWEDWAETWAHYLHMVDLLETAQSWQLTVGAIDAGQVFDDVPDSAVLSAEFSALLQAWVPLTLVTNSLTRSLGHADAYPFALSYKALRKIQFVHEVVTSRSAQADAPA